MERLTISEITGAAGGTLLCGSGDTVITHFSIDSRDVPEGESTLFVPIIGEKVDAHKFLPDVFEKGAAAAFTSHGDVIDESRPHILVDDTVKALGRVAAWYRKRFDIPVVGVTGSVGKTSTKEMIAAALSAKYNVLKTAGNQNSEIGVPLTLFNIEKQHEIAVVEMGISDFGEMDQLVEFAHPETAAVTNIGVAHIANLKTQENIMNEKLRIALEFGDKGSLYLNGNDPMLRAAAGRYGANCRLYGTDEAFPYSGTDSRIEGGRQYFTYKNAAGEKYEVCINQIGEHNMLNAVAALAIAERYGVETQSAIESIASYGGIAMRQQIKQLGQGIKVIDDTYNASPDSIKSGVNVLEQMEAAGRRIAVLGDVLELGEMSDKLHYDTGVYIAGKKIDEVVGIGEGMSHLIRAIEDSKADMVTHHFPDNASAGEYIKEAVGPGDVVLVKGSRGMHEEEIVKLLEDTK
ncbi:MAG: UDP-N-acetylmuramoyl-tripeptide--D-alanyl-D-alanine ligase [Lachnospiraceae bacterium]|nr:UDP-N-acetylmuramoyl-tripeptide--D-alanyl-D-alanine ligase [Lachnospiraceae bacterium]